MYLNYANMQKHFRHAKTNSITSMMKFWQLLRNFKEEASQKIKRW
jgi:hypothetical protein